MKCHDLKIIKEKNIKNLAGIDEAGRGPLAGPVVIASVILNWPNDLDLSKDSKKLTEQERNEYYTKIYNVAKDIQIAIIDNNVIDSYNILEATKMGIKKVIKGHKIKPDFILLDYVKMQKYDNLLAIVKGDEKSITIAAASVIAKVTRDRLMRGYDMKYPGYNFAKNKGYPTKEHKEAIIRLGLSPIHRKTFKGCKEYSI